MTDRKGRHDSTVPTESLADGGRDAFDELAEEFAARCREGAAPSISEYEVRYPEHAGRIRKLLPTVAMMEQLKRDTLSARGGRSAARMPERFGEFRVVRELGRGGMGVVYEAVQESLGRHVALKVIHHVSLDFKRLQRFEREAKAIAQLHHTNIVPIYAVGEHDGLPYYAMQRIQGVGLDALLDGWRRDGAPQGAERWRLVARVGVQAADALQYAHDQGVLHRDVKPGNLLLDAQESVWVTDFGLAKLAGQDDLTASGDVVGTLRYLSPETLRGESDRRSDVYSLGLTLYELLTLTPPFGDLSQSELLRRVSEGEPASPRRLDPAIPRDLETIVLKATAREPGHRYATAGAVADDLKRFLEDRPVQARRATVSERTWRWSRRNPGTAVLAAAAAGGLVLAAVVGWVGYVSTMGALEQERRSRAAAEVAEKKAENNFALSLKVFGKLFETLAEGDPLLPPPLGAVGFRPPAQGEGFPGDLRLPPPPPDGRGGPPHDHCGHAAPPSWSGHEPRPASPEQRPPSDPRGKPRPSISQENVAFLVSVLEFYEEFAGKNAKDLKLQGEAAWAYRKVGALYEWLGRDDDAEKAYDRAIALFEDLVRRFPGVREYRLKLVQTYDMANPWAADPTSLERLERWLARAGQLIDQLVAEVPEDFDYTLAQAHVYAKYGAVLQRLQRPADAEARYRKSIALDGELIRRAPEFDWPRLDRATTREVLALLELEANRQDEAGALLEAAAEDLQTLGDRDHVPPPLAGRFVSLAQAFNQLGDSERAEQMTVQAEKAASRRRPPLFGHGPKPPERGGPRP